MNMQSSNPKIGFMNVADPRLGPDFMARINREGAEMAAFLEEKGLEVVQAQDVIDCERKVRPVVENMIRQGCNGVIARIAWFHRSNVPVAIAQASGLPIMICAIPNPNDTGFEGLALAHGALDEVGLKHQLNYGDMTESGSRRILAWAMACRVKSAFFGAVYGEIGGRSLEMIPGSSDPNQLRKIFGFHVDPLDQWTLIHRAETIPEAEWKPVAKKWREEYKSVEVRELTMERSAKLYLAGNKIFKERDWDFAGIQCQTEMIDNYLAPCLPVAQWNEDGFILSCETDINNALGMFLIQKALGKPGMFCDIFHYDLEKNIIHALNCGTAAPSLAGGGKNIRVREQTEFQGTWDEEKQCSLCKGGACNQFILPPGPVTVLRFGRIDGEYVVQVEEGTAIEHEYNPDELTGVAAIWPFAYIQLKDVVPEKFIRNMRSHHAVIARASCRDIVEEFAALYNIRVLN